MFGANSILPKEHGGKFFSLPLIAFLEVRGRVCVCGHSGDPGRELFIGAAAHPQIPFFWKKKYVFVSRYFLIYLFRSSMQDEVGAVCTWDSSVHDSLCLNRVTPGKCNTKKTNRDSQRERGSGIFLCREGALCFPLGFRFAPGPDGVPPQMPYPSSSLPSSLSGGCTAYIGKHTNGLLKPPSLLCPVMVLRKRRWEGGRNICGFCFRSCEEEPLCSAAETFPALSLAAPPNHGAGPTRAYDRRRRFFSLQYKYEPNLTICYISANERAYLIVKSVVRLSHPAPMDLVLRKRVCFNVYKRHSLTDRIRRRMGHTSSLTAIGVIYEIVSNIPKVSLDLCNTRCLLCEENFHTFGGFQHCDMDIEHLFTPLFSLPSLLFSTLRHEDPSGTAVSHSSV